MVVESLFGTCLIHCYASSQICYVYLCVKCQNKECKVIENKLLCPVLKFCFYFIFVSQGRVLDQSPVFGLVFIGCVLNNFVGIKVDKQTACCVNLIFLKENCSHEIKLFLDLQNGLQTLKITYFCMFPILFIYKI